MTAHELDSNQEVFQAVGHEDMHPCLLNIEKKTQIPRLRAL